MLISNEDTVADEQTVAWSDLASVSEGCALGALSSRSRRGNLSSVVPLPILGGSVACVVLPWSDSEHGVVPLVLLVETLGWIVCGSLS